MESSLLLLLCGLIMIADGEASITVTDWGSIGDKTIEKYTLRNDAGQEVDIVTYGATITSVRTADKDGNVADVVLGFDNIKGYVSKSNPYFGATIGRVANRISKAQFMLDGKTYNLSKNAGENTLHGGSIGWSAKIWNASVVEDALMMSLLSEDGDEGFPGAVIATVRFTLNNDGELCIEMKAFVSKATPINLTNHSYFNLAGHGTNAAEIYNHRVTLNADYWTVTDSESIPTGLIQSVDGTVLDLRNSTKLADVIDKVPGGGYDHNYCLNGHKKKFVAKVLHPETGRYLEVYTDQPGVQFYTANFLPETDEPGIRGKDGKEYYKHGAFCLETQNYPDAVNHINFPNSIIRPGCVYRHNVVYKFGFSS